MIYLLGGWDDKINFLPDVLKFDVVDGVLSKDSSFRFLKLRLSKRKPI